MPPRRHYDVSSEANLEGYWKTLKKLLTHIWPKNRRDLKIRLLFALVALVIAKVAMVAVPFFLKLSIDALNVEKSVLAIPLALIIAYGAVMLSSYLFSELRDYLFVRVSQHAQRTIGLETFQHIHGLSLNFHLSRQTGGLTRVVERGVRSVHFIVRVLIFRLCPIFLEIGLVTAVLVYTFDLTFALIPLATVLVFAVYTLIVTQWGIKFRRAQNLSDNEANTKAVDSLLNYETVKYFGNEEHEYRRYDHALAGYEEAAVKSQFSLSALNLGQKAIVVIGLVVAMVLAGRGVVAGTLTVGDFVLINTYLIQLSQPLHFLGFFYREIKQSLVDMEKVFELLEVEGDVQDRPEAPALQLARNPEDRGKVSFEEVTFSYREDRTILKKISFTVEPGQKVALVGPSGAGKSTISRLLFRFYDPQQGKITIDGQDISEVTQKSLRAAIGIVPQDTVLFNDTIGYNISYGRPEAGWKEIVQAAKMAQIHEFVESLPQKFDTLVGERGLKLSGGEKQRVAIARTILKDPAILVFDEATSALDSHTEKEIQGSLEEVAKNHTTLVIAHRLSTIVDADQILVLVEGEIVERGRHSELLEKGGEYADLWNRQQEAQEIREKLKEIAD